MSPYKEPLLHPYTQLRLGLQSQSLLTPRLAVHNCWSGPHCNLWFSSSLPQSMSTPRGTKHFGTPMTYPPIHQCLSTQVPVTSRDITCFRCCSHRVLQLSSGIDDMGAPHWELVLSLLGAWTIAFFCMIKGIKSSGKVRPAVSLVQWLGQRPRTRRPAASSDKDTARDPRPRTTRHGCLAIIFFNLRWAGTQQGSE